MMTGQQFLAFLQSHLPEESRKVKGVGEHHCWSLEDLDENKRMLICVTPLYSTKEAKIHFRILLNGCVKHALIVESVEIPAIKFDWRGQVVDNTRENKAIIQFGPRVSFTLSELLLGLGKVANGPN